MNIVSKIKARVRCEVYPCKDRAEYAIGTRRQTSFLVCKEHMRQIIDEGTQLLADESEEFEEAVQEVTMQEEAETSTALYSDDNATKDQAHDETGEICSNDSTKPQISMGDSEESPSNLLSDKKAESEEVPEQPPEEPAAVNNDAAAAPVPAPYSCKHCGAPFQTKPELMTHSKICPSKPPKKD